MTLRFRCGHVQAVDPDKTLSPRCVVCGDRYIARVFNADPPRISGCATGPLVQSRALEPIAVNLAKTPLPLKKDDYATD